MRLLIYLAAALALAATAVGVGLWLGSGAPGVPDDIPVLEPDPACDLRAGACTLALPDGGRVTLSISPRDIPPMTPLTLEARVTGSGLHPRWLEFVGVDMDMGFNRATLAPAQGGRFTGSGMIPVCVSDRMLWEARLLLNDGGQWVAAPFRFEVTRP